MRKAVNRVLGYFGYTLKPSTGVRRKRNGKWDGTNSYVSQLERDESGRWIYPEPKANGCCGGSCSCKNRNS